MFPRSVSENPSVPPCVGAVAGAAAAEPLRGALLRVAEGNQALSSPESGRLQPVSQRLGSMRGPCCLRSEACGEVCHSTAAAGLSLPSGAGFECDALNTQCVRETEIPSNCSRAEGCSRSAANWCQRGCVLACAHGGVTAGCRGCPIPLFTSGALHFPADRRRLTRGGIRRILFRRLLEMDFWSRLMQNGGMSPLSQAPLPALGRAPAATHLLCLAETEMKSAASPARVLHEKGTVAADALILRRCTYWGVKHPRQELGCVTLPPQQGARTGFRLGQCRVSTRAARPDHGAQGRRTLLRPAPGCRRRGAVPAARQKWGCCHTAGAGC